MSDRSQKWYPKATKTPGNLKNQPAKYRNKDPELTASAKLMNKISLLVVEDHEIYSHVLLDLLSKDEKIQIVAAVPTAEEGLEKLGELKVDLVLVDISLPRMDGIAFVKLVQDQYPNLPCVMVSGYLSAQYVQRALQAGARGYLLKDKYSEIPEGIWKVINGETYISKGFQEMDFGF